ncbi:MAG: phenylalanine--tRNA ligase subunit beta [Endozoicomonas sp. (ex Botrylloides leachii)]|nr:phenylalanine--tRNA ligase subunit beta [Endozoicomonas sp. (ex Botrylloides leachii)]
MKFSEQWLRQWVAIDADTQALVDKITMAGLEVDSVTPAAANFSGVVVAEVIACEPHPDADKLRVTSVSTGSETFQVVCAAPNVRKGIRVPFAMIGAVLPSGFRIKKTTLRGVASFGMLCAEEEMGMADSSDGLMELPSNATLGQNIREYLMLEDNIIDVDLTPNRGDCLSITGLAREASANFLAEVSIEPVTDIAATVDDSYPVNLIAKEGCPRYVGRVIKNIDANRSAPSWLTERLRRSGIRSVDPIVDVTNYVMLELGQPMHSFDLNKLQGTIQVRLAKEGEHLVLLDGQTVKLNDSTLVIADDQQILGIAGIMGGKYAGVSKDTCNIFLESAFFSPVTLAGKARTYGLNTDASHRFERGVDSELQRKAIERATALILAICGGEPGPVTEVTSIEHLPAKKYVNLRSQKVTSLLGIAIEDYHIEALLKRLGLDMTRRENSLGAEWQVRVPSWRFDIAIEEDLIEEIGRLYGYNKLPITMPTALLKMKQIDESIIQLSDLRRVLVSRGYQEAVSFSFIDPELSKCFDPEREAVALANPIASDLSVMRTSLLPGLVKAMAYNLNRQQNRIRLFETGQVFINKGNTFKQCSIWQEQKIAAVITGRRLPESWNSDTGNVDFYDLKGDVETLLALGRKHSAFHFVRGDHAAMHPGQCAAIYCNDTVVGHIGAIHPLLAKQMSVPVNSYLVELTLDVVINGAVTQFETLSKFPEVRRDLAVIVEKDITADKLCEAIRKESGQWLRDIRVFDVYAGKGIEEGSKSLAIGLTLQHPSRTLKDEDVNELVDRVVTKLEQDFNASLRK